jgi:uncharacterized membrane protein YgdD (TMEM256/DUF423 family)
MTRFLLIFASFSGAFAVILSAWLSHGQQVVEQRLVIALFFHFMHTCIILILATNATLVHNKFYQISSFLFVFGILLFSGGIYLKALTAFDGLSWLTPCGGFMLIIGWLTLAFIGIKK